MWKPFDTAPKEGDFLVWSPKPYSRRSHFAVCSRCKIANGTMDIISGQFAFDMPKPTHWASLPEPPTE